jgi:hypothetical protein
MAEMLALVPFAGEILTILSVIFTTLSNRSGVTKNSVLDAILQLSMVIENHIDEGGMLSAAAKNDIRVRFVNLCKSFRFDDDEIALLDDLKATLFNELGIKIPGVVKINRRGFLQDRKIK